MNPLPADMEDLLRDLAPQVLGALVRRYGRFEVAEDAVQEALLVAVKQWTADGVPEEPRSWLIKIASRRMIDLLRSDQARRQREDTVIATDPGDRAVAPAADEDAVAVDDSLLVLLLCCHPAITPASQTVLTLRAVGGLTTAEIAAGMLLPEATVAQRISRAKSKIRQAGSTFAITAADLPDRLDVVRQVLYLIFTEAHTASSGRQLVRRDLAVEAIRLTRLLRRLDGDDRETRGLLALLLLQHARRDARVGPDGILVPLAEQDRSRWDTAAIGEGRRLVVEALRRSDPAALPGPYQLQAAIAAVHSEATGLDDTDWDQIVGLYDLLVAVTDNPVAKLNRAVAVGMRDGPAAGLALLEMLTDDPQLARGHRLPAVRGQLYRLAGDHVRAAADLERAARLTANLAEQRFLLGLAAKSGDRAAG